MIAADVLVCVGWPLKWEPFWWGSGALRLPVLELLGRGSVGPDRLGRTRPQGNGGVRPKVLTGLMESVRFAACLNGAM